MQVLSGPSEYRFTVTGTAGPVKLSVMNAVGTVVAKLSGTAGRNGADLTWEYGSMRRGVYLYSVETPSGQVAGKLTIIR